LASARDKLGAVRPAWSGFPVWPIGLVLLLVIEFVVLKVRFELKGFDERGLAWLRPALRWGVKVFVVVVLAMLVLWGPRLRREYRTLWPEGGSSPGRWPLLAGHLAAFGVFFGLTARICDGHLGALPGMAGWIAAWVAVAILTLVLGLTALLPPGSWWPAARRWGRVLVAGLAIGALACAFGQVVEEALWRPMSRSTLVVVHALLGLVAVEAVCQPERLLVGTTSFTVEIQEHCSGLEGIGLIWVVLGVYLARFRRELHWPRAWVLVPLGTVVIWLSNAVRIALLVAIGTWGTPEVALGGFHSQAGWLAFNLVALGLVAIARRWRWILVDPGEGEPGASPTTVFLAPLMAIVAVAMVTAAFSCGFDRAYPLRVVAAAVVFWAFRRDLGEWLRPGWWSWPAVAIGALAFAVWRAPQPEVSVPPAAGVALAQGLADLGRIGAAAWLACRVLGSVVTVPIAEELAFRGYLGRRLIAANFQSVPAGAFSGMSLLVSSAAFGAMHGRWLAGTLAGVLYALALYRRGRLTDPIVAHATTNALIAAEVLGLGNWSLWS
jgi:exosortase E/protease (VPEID-CTERM system)